MTKHQSTCHCSAGHGKPRRAFGTALLTEQWHGARLILPVIALTAPLGCFDSPGTIKQFQQEADQHRLDLANCQREKFECESRCAELTARIENQPKLATVELDDLFLVNGIKILSRSGGIDLDDQPGDEGVVVYVQPVDAVGDAIKAAGAISIQVTDLTQLGSPKPLGTFEYAKPEVIKQSWYGGFLTNHYTFKCPFPETAGAIPDEVHIRVVFLDWLTGREFSKSATVSVEVNR